MVDRVVNYVGNRVKVWRADPHLQEVVSGASVALILKVVGAGLTFCFNLLLARTLGAEGAGLYFLALTVTTVATVFGRMGLDNALLRFTAANVSVDNWSAVRGLYQKGMKFALAASTASAIVMYFLAPLLADMLFRKPELANPLRWMAFSVVPLSLLILHAEMLKGLRLIRDSLIVFGVGVPALSLVWFYFLGGIWGVNGAAAAYVIAAIFTALLGIRLWRSATPRLRKVIGNFDTRELLQSSIPLFWVASLNLVIDWTSIIALGIWGTKADVGIFSMALRTAMLTSFVLMSVNSISAPKFAALYKKKEMDALGSMARNTAKLMTFVASPLLVLFLLVPEQVMGIFGTGFTAGAALLSILAIGQFINVATGSVGYLLMMSGNECLMRNNIVIIAVISISLNVALVPSFGALGAAIATTICVSAVNLIATYLVWSRLGIWTIPWIDMIFARVK